MEHFRPLAQKYLLCLPASLGPEDLPLRIPEAPGTGHLASFCMKSIKGSPRRFAPVRGRTGQELSASVQVSVGTKPVGHLPSIHPPLLLQADVSSGLEATQPKSRLSQSSLQLAAANRLD